MPDAKDYVAGSSSLVMGVDSYTQSAELDDREFVAGMNVVCRGGIVQTRPGSRSLFCLPDGNFQGSTMFTPQNGVAHLVFAVEGAVYVSPAPFTEYRRLGSLQFSNTSKYIAWASCLKSTDYDVQGNLITLANPFSVLIMQDGQTRAAYWDGSVAGHMNPSSPPWPNQTDNIPGYNGTPIGLWMIWSGNRLWVSREGKIFAGDLGNPMKFTETIYLNEARCFYLSGPCTGMIEVPTDNGASKGFIAFTNNDGTLFQSYIQDRTAWLNTTLFQNTILPNIGCVAPRSLITQYGLNWWFGPRGFTNLNAAFRQNISSRVDYQDNEMFSSKAYIGPDLSGICAGYYENYLMVSVPSGDVLNRHTWVLDQAPFEGNVNAWCGIWTGWRPIEWTRGLVNGSERIFFGSKDYDGKNRIWEAMLPERKDNGCRITCYAQLRDHAAGNLDQKRYDWTKFFLSQLYGPIDLNVYVASTKGGFQLQKNYHLEASEGQVFGDVKYGGNGPYLIGNRVQSRTIRTPSGQDDNECNSCGVESKEGNMVDYAFCNLLVWSGQMGIRAYQLHMHEWPDRDEGDCEEDEVAPRTLNSSGCSGLELLVDGQVFETFSSIKEGSTTLANGGLIYIQQTASSSISQRNADDMAICKVDSAINRLIGSNLAPGVYGSGGSMVIVSAPPAPDTPQCVAPVINSQPEDQSIFFESGTSFSISSYGTATLNYQWQVSTNMGGSWSDIVSGGVYSGVNLSVLTLTSVPIGYNGYQYRCLVGNPCGGATSIGAVLTVQMDTSALIVGGGGGGGWRYGGGGGGGQAVVQVLFPLDFAADYPVVVGAGGAGASADPNYRGQNGSSSSFNGQTAQGGGGGGGGGDFGSQQTGGAGASGGGGSFFNPPGAPAPGGAGGSGGGGGAGFYAGGDNAGEGGGGGAGGNGHNSLDGTSGGDGGTGITSMISGVPLNYAGGGGGGGTIAPGAGVYGGGNGAIGNDTGVSGATNTGGGGGGQRLGLNPSGSGAYGVVIVRYPGSPRFTGGAITSVGSDTVHTFLSSGTLAHL